MKTLRIFGALLKTWILWLTFSIFYITGPVTLLFLMHCLLYWIDTHKEKLIGRSSSSKIIRNGNKFGAYIGYIVIGAR